MRGHAEGGDAAGGLVTPVKREARCGSEGCLRIASVAVGMDTGKISHFRPIARARSGVCGAIAILRTAKKCGRLSLRPS